MDKKSRRLLILTITIVCLTLASIFLLSRYTNLPFTCHAIFIRGPFLQNAQTNRITICWETDEPVPATVKVFEQNGKILRSVKTASKALRQEVSIDELEAGEKYRYEVKSRAKSSTPLGGTFCTPPPPGTPIEFVAWGDSRNHPHTCEEIAKSILKIGVPFSVHTGDLVGGKTGLSRWNPQFFEPCRDLLRSSVIWPAIGNHELEKDPEEHDGRIAFTQIFALPHTEHYYSFDYGDAHFLVLDSNHDFWNNQAQYHFAAADLEATRARWRFAVWHHPAFSSGSYSNETYMRTRYCPLMARHNVDVIITGHDHNYQRSKPIKHHYEPNQKHHYIHLVSGGGGARLYSVREGELWHEKGLPTNHYIHFRIDGDLLQAKVVDLDDQVIDTFTIDKSKPTTDAVAYELIEMQRRNVITVNVDVKGAKLQPFILDTNQTTGTIRHQLTNPLPDPITIITRTGPSEGVALEPKTITKTMPANSATIIEHSFTITDPEKILP
ncbi:MAG: metallophosphoesterase, partial [Planctomycetota bacterium]